MNFVSASSNNVKLNDYTGSVIALSYVSETMISSEIDGRMTDSPAVRAHMLAIVDGLGVDLGETLVFPDAIRETLVARKGDTVVGKLVKKDHSTKQGWTYYNLEELAPKWFDEAVRRFQAATPVVVEAQDDSDAADEGPF